MAVKPGDFIGDPPTYRIQVVTSAGQVEQRYLTQRELHPSATHPQLP